MRKEGNRWETAADRAQEVEMVMGPGWQQPHQRGWYPERWVLRRVKPAGDICSPGLRVLGLDEEGWAEESVITGTKYPQSVCQREGPRGKDYTT